MLTNRHRFNKLTEIIIGSSYSVANTLGRGFVERVYSNALTMELQDKALSVKQEFPITVYYKNRTAGNFIGDLLVEECILVETKAVSGLNNLHMAQCLNYLKASGLKLCLLINFGAASVQVKRIINNF